MPHASLPSELSPGGGAYNNGVLPNGMPGSPLNNYPRTPMVMYISQLTSLSIYILCGVPPNKIP